MLMQKAKYEVRGQNGAGLHGLMTTPIRGDYLIHVDVGTILKNKEKGEHDQVVAIRPISKMDSPVMCREVMWDAPSRFVHHDFQRIPGTSVQNWIETDGPLLLTRDDATHATLRGKSKKKGWQHQHIRGCFVIHVAAPVLMRNRKEGRNDPVIAVRNAMTDWAKDVIYCRKVEWNGVTRLCHRPTTPIPDTNGRGVSFVETDAVLTLYVDGAPPIILHPNH